MRSTLGCHICRNEWRHKHLLKTTENSWGRWPQPLRTTAQGLQIVAFVVTCPLLYHLELPKTASPPADFLPLSFSLFTQISEEPGSSTDSHLFSCSAMPPSDITALLVLMLSTQDLVNQCAYIPHDNRGKKSLVTPSPLHRLVPHHRPNSSSLPLYPLRITPPGSPSDVRTGKAPHISRLWCIVV